MVFRKMDLNKVFKIPSELSVVAFLSSGLTLLLSVTYTVLCILALFYRFQCDVGLASGASGSSYFINTVYRLYIQTSSCDNPDSSPPAGVNLTDADTVFIFVLVILTLSVISCVAAIAIVLVVVDEKKSQYIFATVWVHVCISFCAAVVDLVLAIFFGLDNAKLREAMDNSLPGIVINYRHDVLRMGSQLLMAVALKGYLAHVVNAVLLTLLAVYATRFRNRLQSEEHSIHKRGAINAYELQKRNAIWHNQSESDLPFTRGQHLNAGFEHDERRSPRSPGRAPVSPLSDYSNRDYDRSESWQHSRGHPQPFSYVEEPRRARAPAAEPWRRQPWPPAPPAPPVPAPDYSPPARRLKSALKPNYM